MQDYSSYEQHIQNLLKAHSNTLQQLKTRESACSPKEVGNVTNIDETIRQSQRIVQQSLELLEKSIQPKINQIQHQNNDQKRKKVYVSQLQLDQNSAQKRLEFEKMQRSSRKQQSSDQRLNSQFNIQDLDEETLDLNEEKYLNSLQRQRQKSDTQIMLDISERSRVQSQNQQTNSKLSQQRLTSQSILANWQELDMEDNKGRNREQSERVWILQKYIKDLMSQLEEKSKQCNQLQSRLLESETARQKLKFQLESYKSQISELKKSLGTVLQNEKESMQLDHSSQQDSYLVQNEELKQKLIKAYEASFLQQEIINQLKSKSKQDTSILPEHCFITPSQSKKQRNFQTSEKDKKSITRKYATVPKLKLSTVDQNYSTPQIPKTSRNISQKCEYELKMRDNEQKIKDLERRLGQESFEFEALQDSQNESKISQGTYRGIKQDSKKPSQLKYSQYSKFDNQLAQKYSQERAKTARVGNKY